jgi:Haem-NO-binding
MRGMILEEFVEFVEREHAPAAGAVLAGIHGGDGGPAAGDTHDHQELVALVARLSSATGASSASLLQRFGSYLFARFAVLYPVFFVEIDSALGFMERIETYVHGEVLKLHPDARFPRFECRTPGPGRLELTYRSHRPFADLAEGMIRGCIAHFAEPIDVRRENLDAEGRSARFSLELRG